MQCPHGKIIAPIKNIQNYVMTFFSFQISIILLTCQTLGEEDRLVGCK